MMKKFRTFFNTLSLALLLGVGLLSYATPVAAAGLIPDPTGKCPADYAAPTETMTPLGQPCANGDTRDYSLGDVKTVLVRIGNFMLGVSGAVALVVFTLGGFYWVMSAGSSKMVEKGKTMMKSGIIGLLILFSAYTIVAFSVKLFAGSEGDQYLPAVVAPGTVTPSSTAAANPAPQPSGFSPMQSYAAYTGGVQTTVASCVGSAWACANQTSCNGAAISGTDCTTAGMICCRAVADSTKTNPCEKLGGSCTDSSKVSCDTGTYVTGLCPGTGAAIRCCLKP